MKIAEVLNKLGDFSEGSHRFQQSLELARRVADSQIEARALAGWGWALRMEGNVEEAKQVLEQGLEVARASNDLAGMAVLNKNLGVAWYATMEEARRYFLEGLRLYREIGDQVGIGNSLNNLGIISNALKDLEGAQTYHLESLEIRRRIDDRFGVANSLHNTGNVARALGDYASALHSHKEALATFHELGSRWSIAASLVEIGHDHVFLGQNESAWDAYREALAEAAALENTPLIVEIIAGASALHIQAGDLDRAARWLGFVIGNSNYNPDIAKIAEPLIDQLRSRMDTSAIEAVMKEGEHFSLEQLVEELVG